MRINVQIIHHDMEHILSLSCDKCSLYFVRSNCISPMNHKIKIPC